MTPLQAVFDASGAAELFLLARLLFGLVLGFMGLNHFLDAESMTGYAEAKGAPMPALSVYLTGGMLLLGGLGVAVGAFRVLAAGALAVFFLVATPLMHDFWNADDDGGEMTHFLKNLTMLGASLAFLAVAGVDWPYALNLGLF